METRNRPEQEPGGTTDREGPEDVNSHRGGLGERAADGSQADVMSPTGTRIDTDTGPTEADVMRKGGVP